MVEPLAQPAKLCSSNLCMRMNLINSEKAWRTCSANALVCFVTKKLVKLTGYYKQELNNSNQTIVKSFLTSSVVTPTTLSSIKRVAGSKRMRTIGAMYKSRFIELSFSPSDDRRITCNTVFNALAAVAPMHTMNPNRWDLVSPQSFSVCSSSSMTFTN